MTSTVNYVYVILQYIYSNNFTFIYSEIFASFLYPISKLKYLSTPLLIKNCFYIRKILLNNVELYGSSYYSIILFGFKYAFLNF